VALHGPAGAGVTVAAGAVLEALVARGEADRVVAIRADACSRPDDLRRAMGVALGAFPAADPDALDAVVTSRVTVLVDDADLAAAAVSELVARWPAARWVLTARGPLPGAAAVEVPPLSDAAMRALLPAEADPAPYLGRPLLALLPGQPVPGRPFAAVDQLPPGEELWAELPMGRPSNGAMPGPWHLPMHDRIVFRRSVREALGLPDEPSSQALAAAIRDRLPDAHRVAADTAGGAPLDDLVLYRTAATRVADPDLAALAASAAARILLRHLEPDPALALVRRVAAERLPSGANAVGLLRWLEADALLELGDDEEAAGLYRSAADALVRGGQKRVVSALARRYADRLAARGEAERASRWLGEARRSTPALEDPVAWADTLRISGDLAASAGELVGASALYDEALQALARVDGAQRTRAAVRLGQASLEIARGQHDLANQLLDDAGRSDDPLLRASVAWRRAELAAHRGRPDAALPWLEEARQGFERAGSVRGLALERRLRGDVHALSGQREEAVATWRAALRWASRDRDLASARRILRRILVVEREGTPGSHLEPLVARLDLVEVLLRVR
jgi:tetratricopeptide (TPR) repeat protein